LVLKIKGSLHSIPFGHFGRDDNERKLSVISVGMTMRENYRSFDWDDNEVDSRSAAADRNDGEVNGFNMNRQKLAQSAMADCTFARKLPSSLPFLFIIGGLDKNYKIIKLQN
jgi:hypothetical protein